MSEAAGRGLGMRRRVPRVGKGWGARRPEAAGMVVAVLTATLRLPESFSLKDKRAVVQSLLRRAAQRHSLSAAEVGRQDDVGFAVVAMAVVSSSAVHADAVLRAAMRFVEESYPVEVVAEEVEHR